MWRISGCVVSMLAREKGEETGSSLGGVVDHRRGRKRNNRNNIIIIITIIIIIDIRIFSPANSSLLYFVVENFVSLCCYILFCEISTSVPRNNEEEDRAEDAEEGEDNCLASKSRTNP